jgi:serine/threonine protein kinase
MSPTSQLTERYRLVSQLGAGGMGRVWLGYDEVLRRDVAVKEIVPPPGLTAVEQDLSNTRSLREARAIARLNHPSVVRIYDVVPKQPYPWIVMEYVPSRSLHQVVAQDGPLPPVEVARIGLAVLDALVAAHRAGVVHRDVKPSNVLMSDQRVVLTDWGLATMEGDATVTRSGMIIGSPAYIAPERAREGSSAPPSDLWSLGATLYAAVEGRAPFERSSAIATLTALATEEPDPPRRAGPLQPVLDGLLRKDPSLRMTAPEAERLLRRAMGRPKLAPTMVWQPPRPRPAEPAEEDAAAAVPSPPVPDDPVVPEVASTPDPAPTKLASMDVKADRDRRTPWLTLAGILLAVMLVGVIGVVLATRETPPRRTPGGAPSAAATPHPSTPAPAAPQASGQSSAAQPAGATLPAGWHRYTDQTGFTVAVPDGWSVFRRSGMVYFKEPNGPRLFGVDQTDQPRMDPVADWQTQEAYRVSRGDFPEYERVAIQHVDYHVTTADWEFRYTDHGVRTHVINRGAVFNDHQAYGLYWSTPEDEWAANVDNFRLITDTFQGKP